MRKIQLILLLAVAGLVSACEEPAKFDEPQPSGVDALTSFPEKLQGTYMNTEDSSLLKLTGNTLFGTYAFDYKFTANTLDSQLVFTDDSFLVDSKDKTQYPVTRQGDSLVGHINWTDTLFHIPYGHILKKDHGLYFLNIPSGSGWEVQKLELDDKRLTLSSIYNKEDITKLKAVSASTLDSMPYRFKPSKREFRKFVRNDGFGSTQTYIRIKG